MGIIPVNESKYDASGSITLYLNHKCCTLVKNDNNIWKLADDYLAYSTTIYGDDGTLVRIEKLYRILDEHPMSTSASSQQASAFKKVLDNTTLLPGDWNTGLTVLQSFYNVFWEAYLEPVNVALDWKNITQDCRRSYYSSSCLAMYQYHTVVEMLLHTFVLNKIDNVRYT